MDCWSLGQVLGPVPPEVAVRPAPNRRSPVDFAPRTHARFAVVHLGLANPGIGTPGAHLYLSRSPIASYGVMTRRMILLVVVLMGLTALVATLAPPERVRTRGEATPAPRAAQPGGTLPDAAPAVTARLPSGPGRPRTVRAELGDEVRIDVEAETATSVALGDLDIQQAEPGLPARFELLADTPGRYPLVVVDDQRRIGTLVVR